MQLVRLLVVVALAVTVAACGTSRVASVLGACDGRPKAGTVMYGADQISQDFLDDTIEDNVARCTHERPAARPDPRVALVQQKQAPKAIAKTKVKPKAKTQPKWWQKKPKPAPKAKPLPEVVS